MVLEPLLWPFLSSLSSLVWLPFFLTLPPITTAIAAFCCWTSDVIQASSLGSGPAVLKEFHTAQDHCFSHHHCKYCSDFNFDGTTEIVQRRSTHSWKPCRHRSPYVILSATSALATSPLLTRQCHVSPSWHHLHVIRWLCHRWPLPLTVITCGPALTVDFDQRWLFQGWPGFPYPVFRVDFTFAVCFCILCL